MLLQCEQAAAHGLKGRNLAGRKSCGKKPVLMDHLITLVHPFNFTIHVQLRRCKNPLLLLWRRDGIYNTLPVYLLLYTVSTNMDSDWKSAR
jgi:hypothetical protein